MIHSPGSPQTPSMVRVLTRFRRLELALSASLLAAAMVAACGGKALNVGSEGPASAGGGGGVGGSARGGAGSAAGGAAGGGSVALAGSMATAPHPGSGGTGGSKPSQPMLSPEELAGIQWPADTPCVESPDSPKVGTWKGHWPEPLGVADADVVVRIKGLTEEGVPCGTVAIGNGPAPPPVTDADAIYPPSQGMGGLGPALVGPPITTPWPGYEYRMLNVRSTESRLAFTITDQEILRPWCQLQTPVEGSLSCLPEWTNGASFGPSQPCTISGPNLPEMSVPCFKMQYCSTYSCFCYDGACDVSLQGQQTAFELHWDGPALEGSVNQTQLLFLDPVP